MMALENMVRRLRVPGTVNVNLLIPVYRLAAIFVLYAENKPEISGAGRF
jgi:hypothetical protein